MKIYLLFILLHLYFFLFEYKVIQLLPIIYHESVCGVVSGTKIKPLLIIQNPLNEYYLEPKRHKYLEANIETHRYLEAYLEKHRTAARTKTYKNLGLTSLSMYKHDTQFLLVDIRYIFTLNS